MTNSRREKITRDATIKNSSPNSFMTRTSKSSTSFQIKNGIPIKGKLTKSVTHVTGQSLPSIKHNSSYTIKPIEPIDSKIESTFLDAPL